MNKQNLKAESVRRQLLALATMSRPELCEKWRDLYGNEPPNSSREFLRRRLRGGLFIIASLVKIDRIKIDKLIKLLHIFIKNHINLYK